MHCSACGAKVIGQAVYCHKCGERIEPTEDSADQNHDALDGPPPQRIFGDRSRFQRNSDDKTEEEIWQGSYSPKAMIGLCGVEALVTMLLLVGGVLWAQSATSWIILISIILLLGIYTSLVLAYRRLSVRYTLTTQRFLHERGIFRRTNDRIEVLDMDDISFEQSLLERLMGVGTIRIVSTDRSHPDMSIRGIDNVKDVCEMFDDARRAERRRRGLYVEHI